MVVILDIGFEDLVVEMIFRLRVGLGVAGDVTHEQIGKAVAGGNGHAAVEYQIAFEIGIRQLVFLRVYIVSAHLQLVLAQALGEVVAKGIRRIRILPWKGGRPFAESSSVRPLRVDTEIRQLALKVGEQTGHGEIGASRPHRSVRIVLVNVVGGVAGHKFVEQGGRNRCGQSGDQTYSRTNKVGANGGKVSASPGYFGIRRLPGVMNGAKCRPQLGVDVVVDTKQFLMPMGGLGNGGRKEQNSLPSRSSVRESWASRALAFGSMNGIWLLGNEFPVFGSKGQSVGFGMLHWSLKLPWRFASEGT